MLKQNPYYDSLCEQINPYQAVMQIAQQSRQVCSDLSCRIDMSRAMDFVANGNKPDPEEYKDHRLDKVDDYLCGVEDKDVAIAIKLSYMKSLEVNNLVYVYDKVKEPNRRAKVRIVVKMLWQDGPYAK